MSETALKTDEIEDSLSVDHTPPPEQPKAVPTRKVEPLKFNEMPASEHDYGQFSIHPEIGVTIEDILKPEYWVHLIPRLQMGAEIRVLAKDMSYRAELTVTYPDGKNVRLKCFAHCEFDAVKPEFSMDLAKQYQLNMRGMNKWCIQRLSDGEFIKEFIPTKNEAVVYLDKYLAMLGGDKQAEEYLDALEY